ncbi:MAG: thiol-disulfide oxidoreductase [Ignavibacteria bacterium RBG_13_36_8]|nr:MAG: thiol-disulfide oxidoreductase [Ignavibacteria bacterium RBG_13_36_8]
MNHPIILFDGVCNFCNASVNFVIKRDKNRIFRYAALQSAAGQRLLEKYNLSCGVNDTFILVEGKNIYQKSTASLRVLKSLPFLWKLMLSLFLIPTSLRDLIYNFIAGNRYKWFGKRAECMIPTPEVRNLFLK